MVFGANLGYDYILLLQYQAPRISNSSVLFFDINNEACFCFTLMMREFFFLTAVGWSSKSFRALARKSYAKDATIGTVL